MHDTIKGFVVILGSPNDQYGNLSEMGQGRVALGLTVYHQLSESGYRFLLTGGYGQHFNTTDKPNAFYAQQILLESGVPPHHIVEFAESRNTLDDALQARPIVDRYGAHHLVVISSDFHIERVKYVFSHVFPDKKLEYHGAPYLSSRPAEERSRLEQHELRELSSLRERGESIVGGAFKLDSWRVCNREIKP